jgi:hypothetical protein
LFLTPPPRLRNDRTTATHHCDLRRERRKSVASRMNAVTVSYISSGLEIGPDILHSAETIVEYHKLARVLLWIMASIHVQVG